MALPGSGIGIAVDHRSAAHDRVVVLSELRPDRARGAAPSTLSATY